MRSGVTEDAALVVVVMQLGAIRTFASTGQQKNLSRRQHAQRRPDEIDPKGVPAIEYSAGPNARAGFVLIPDIGDSKAMYTATRIAAK
jgi:hypothetical protein